MIKNPVLGAICGDIIGSTYEFYRGSLSKDFPLFTDNKDFTDDTVMTIAIANWLLNDKQDLIKELQTFGRQFQGRGYGGTFGKWIWDEDPKPYNSWGNGSAMRVSSVGCVAKSIEECLELARQSAEVTHDHPEGIKGAQATALAIYLALKGEVKATIMSILEDRFGYDLHRDLSEISNKGFKVSCQESVPEAIICFLLSGSYEETVRNAVMLRGDTDTQACIAGSIAAAYYGIPEDIAKEGILYLDSNLYEIFVDFSRKYNLNY